MGMPMGGMPMQGMPMGGMPMQGMPMQGMPMQGMPMQGSVQIPIQGQQMAPMATMPSMTMGAPTMTMGSMMMPPQMMAPQGETGSIWREFPHLGPQQALPTTSTFQDDMLLQKLYSMYGQQEARDGLPGFPYIGAPFIGEYKGEEQEEEAVEEYDAPVDHDEVRGTQV